MGCSTSSLPVPHHLPEIYSLRKDNWEKDVLYLSSKLNRHWTKTGVSGIIDQLLWSLSTLLLQHPSLQTRTGDRKCTVVKFATPWTVARQAPLLMGFSRQEYWSGLWFPPPGGSSWPKDWTHISCISCIAGRFFTRWAIKEAPWNFSGKNTGVGCHLLLQGKTTFPALWTVYHWATWEASTCDMNQGLNF